MTEGEERLYLVCVVVTVADVEALTVGLGPIDTGVLGRAATVINGPWSSGAFTEAGIDYGIAPVPAGRATQAAAAVSVNMHIDANATEDEAAAANEFMAFWNSEESQTYWSINTGFPPNRTDLPASAVADNPTSAAFSEAVGARLYLQGLTQASRFIEGIATTGLK